MFIRVISTLFFLLTGIPIAYTQPISSDYELYTYKDGLPHNNVTYLLQDSYDMMWIGTYDGLCTYDGYSFKTYTDVFSNKDNSWKTAIRSIYEDKDKNIWVLSRAGFVSCFVRKEQKFIQYVSTASPGIAICFFADNKDRVWIGFENGDIGHVSGDSIMIRQKIDDCVYMIYPKNDAELYTISYDSLYVYNTLNHELKAEKGITLSNFVDADVKNNKALVLSSIGLSIFEINDPSHHVIRKVPQTNRSAAYYRVAMSARGEYCYTDGYMIFYYDDSLNLTEQYTISDHSAYNKSEVINDIIIDKSGLVWIGASAGLYIIDIGKRKFNKYSTNSREGKIDYNYVRAIYEDRDKNLWLGYKSGVVDKLLHNKENNKYTLSKSYLIKSENPILSTNYTINTFTETRDGVLILGGQDGIFTLGPHNFLHYVLPEPQRYLVGEAWSLYEDKYRNLWIGTNGFGLYIYNMVTGELKNHTKNLQSSSISSNSIWHIHEDSRGHILLGTNNGLNEVVNPKETGKLQFINIPMDGKKNNKVWNIKEGKNKTLWIGTIGDGLYQMTAKGEIKHVEGIPAKDIASVTIDNNHNLWIATTNGLYQLLPDSNKKTLFTEDDGLSSSDFNFNAVCYTSGGQLFLGAKNGMISFDPLRIKTKVVYDAPLVITSLFIGGVNSTKALYNNDKIILNRRQNDISIDFVLYDYSTSKNHRFRYKLIGYDNDWEYLPPRHNRAFFTNLNPGEYRFVVESSTNGVNWSNKQAALLITIEPELWQQPLFQLIAAISILVLLAYIIRKRFTRAIKKERRKTELEKKIAGLELKALHAQMNPHFVFNTLNSIQHFILHHNETEANAYLSRFAKLMRLFLESSKERYIVLQTEIELLGLYISLEQLRFEDVFDFKIVTDKKISAEVIKIPSMLIQPFVENAIKHGLADRKGNGMLFVKFELSNHEPNSIKCIVDDNGIGREKAAANKSSLHKSRGTELIEDRIKTYNFIESRKIDIQIIDKEPLEKGTRVEITLPIYSDVRKTIVS